MPGRNWECGCRRAMRLVAPTVPLIKLPSRRVTGSRLTQRVRCLIRRSIGLASEYSHREPIASHVAQIHPCLETIQGKRAVVATYCKNKENPYRARAYALPFFLVSCILPLTTCRLALLANPQCSVRTCLLRPSWPQCWSAYHFWYKALCAAENICRTYLLQSGCFWRTLFVAWTPSPGLTTRRSVCPYGVISVSPLSGLLGVRDVH